MRRVSLACLVLAMTCLPARAEGPSKAEVKKVAKQMSDAFLQGKYDKLLDHTWPEAVKTLGGRKKAIEFLETAMQQMKQAGVSLEKYDVGEPGDFYKEGDNTFVVVPTTLEMKVKKERYRQKGYLLGISTDGGKTWKFVDGAGLANEKEREKVLPKLPAKLKLPEPSKPEAIKE
jgi:hypothetical protein